MLIGRRFGRPGLIGTVARTAVITGTAAMTAGAIAHHQQRRRAQETEAPATSPVSAVPVATDAVAGDLVAQLTQLTDLHAGGALSDAEFEQAKQRLLRG